MLVAIIVSLWACCVAAKRADDMVCKQEEEEEENGRSVLNTNFHFFHLSGVLVNNSA